MIYIYSCIASAISATLAFLLQTKIKENKELRKSKDEREQKKEAALEEGVLCLLRVQLIEYHDKYMSLGYISSHGYENWSFMYKAYKALNGNGMIEHMNEDIEELKIGSKNKE